MRKRVIVIVSGTALLIAVAVGVIATLRNRRQPLPPLDVPVFPRPAEVRVKAVERKMELAAFGSDLFSTVWRRSAGVLCEGRSDAYGYQYNFLFGQARMKSSSYDIEGKNHGGVYPR